MYGTSQSDNMSRKGAFSFHKMETVFYINVEEQTISMQLVSRISKLFYEEGVQGKRRKEVKEKKMITITGASFIINGLKMLDAGYSKMKYHLTD